LFAQEFPLDFVTHHSRKFGPDATFVTPDSPQTWPIKITVRHLKGSRTRVYAYGLGGWKAFVVDNHIKVGDVLIFKLIKWSQFEVLIGKLPVDANADEENAHQASFRFVVTIRRPCEPEHPENHFYLEKDLSLVRHFPLLHF